MILFNSAFATQCIPEEAFATQGHESGVYEERGFAKQLAAQSCGTDNDEVGRTIGPAQYIRTFISTASFVPRSSRWSALLLR